MPRFSIIIPTYRRSEYVSGIVRSLRGQTFTDWEAVFVDDGSKDAALTGELAAAVQADPRIRAVVLEANQGVPGARNRGLAECTGDYVAFLDSDDLYHEWSLRVFDEIISNEGLPAILAGTAVLLDEASDDHGASDVGISYERFPDYFQYRASTRNWWFSPSGVVVRADVLASVGGFWSGRDLCEDIDLWQRLGAGHELVRITSPPIYAYRLHDGGIHLRFREMYDGIARIIRSEKEGIYPGGDSRRLHRIAVIASHARHHAVEFLGGHPALAWKLYCTTLSWNLRLLRWRFVAGFPVMMLFGKLRRQPAV